MSLLEQNTTKQEQMDKRMMELELKAGNSEKYKVETIWDNAVYISKLESGQLPRLYYLIVWKSYPKEKNTWEPLSAVQQLKKLISCFHKKHPEKSIATFLLIDSALPMATPTIRCTSLKQKEGQSADGAYKQMKNWVLNAHNI